MDNRLAQLSGYPFATPLRFNDCALHRYLLFRSGVEIDDPVFVLDLAA